MILSQQDSWYKKEVLEQNSTNLQEIVNEAKDLDVVRVKEVLDTVEKKNRDESRQFARSRNSIYRGGHGEGQKRNRYGEIVYSKSDKNSKSFLVNLMKENPPDIVANINLSYIKFLYRGQFDDKPNGIGEMLESDGNIYRGEVEDGSRMGNGKTRTHIIEDDSSSSISKISHTHYGQYNNNKKNGLGEEYYDNGNSYHGNFEDNLYKGLGEFRWNNKEVNMSFSIYGHWEEKETKDTGYTIYTIYFVNPHSSQENKNWSAIFDSEFHSIFTEEGRKAILCYEEGDYYEGSVLCSIAQKIHVSQRDGIGIYRHKKGEDFENFQGQWSKGELDGKEIVDELQKKRRHIHEIEHWHFSLEEKLAKLKEKVPKSRNELKEIIEDYRNFYKKELLQLLLKLQMEKEKEKMNKGSQKEKTLVFCEGLDKEFKNLLMYLGQMQKLNEIDEQMVPTMPPKDFCKLEKESSELLSNLKKQSWLEDCPNTKFICETLWSFWKDDDTKRIMLRLQSQQNTMFARLEGLEALQINFQNTAFTNLVDLKNILKKQRKEIAKHSKKNLPPKELQNTLDCIQKKLDTSDIDFKTWRENQFNLKVDDVQNLIKKLEEKVEERFDEVSNQMNKVDINLSSFRHDTSSSLRELKYVIEKSIDDNNDNMELLIDNIEKIKSFMDKNNEQYSKLEKWLQEKPSSEDLKMLMIDLEKKVSKGLSDKMDTMKTAIISELGEIDDANQADFTNLRLILNQIQSSIPRDRENLEYFITTELSRVMNYVQTNSSKTEIANLRDSLMNEFALQQITLDDVESQLRERFTILQESLDEVHSDLDSLSKSVLDTQFSLSSQLCELKEDDVDLEDIENIFDSIGFTKTQIEKFQKKKKLKNKDVMALILSSVPVISANMHRLSLNYQETVDQLQSNMEAKCKESKEDQDQLKSILDDLSKIINNMNENMDSLAENVINVKTEVFELDLSKFKIEQQEELQNISTLLKEINKNNSYEERQEELLHKLQKSESPLLIEMKDKLMSSKEAIISNQALQLNVLQSLESQLKFLLIQQKRQTEKQERQSQILIDFIKGQYDLPKYFTILPKSLVQHQENWVSRYTHYFFHPSKWGKTKFKLFFHCGCCKQIPKPACGNNGTGYDIFDASTLQKFAPMIKITVSLIKLTGAVIGFPFPTSDEVIDELDSISSKFIQDDHGEEFGENINNMFDSKDSLSLNIEFKDKLKRTTDICHQELKALMEKIDPQYKNTGLTKTEGGYDSAEKKIEWVCESCKEGFVAEGIHYGAVSGA